MVSLVTLDDVKAAHPPIEHTDDDTLLTGLIEAASASVIGYLAAQAADVIGLGEDGSLPPGAAVPASVQVATVLVARHLYQPPEKLPAEPGALPPLAVMLLYRLTDPPLA